MEVAAAAEEEEEGQSTTSESRMSGADAAAAANIANIAVEGEGHVNKKRRKSQMMQPALIEFPRLLVAGCSS